MLAPWQWLAAEQFASARAAILYPIGDIVRQVESRAEAAASSIGITYDSGNFASQKTWSMMRRMLAHATANHFPESAPANRMFVPLEFNFA